MEDTQMSSSSSSSSSFSLDIHPLSPTSELWLMAEERVQEILCTIQPAVASEHKRKEVIDYIQRLIQGYYDTEVFSFGSVPLKTYLPDGDIDLTALSHKSMEEELAGDVFKLLKCQEKNLEFQVQDVQYIQAQVKIVKCTVKNISIDISFNQVAGLCALCFLEQVDQRIGRDHLFKRSVILIKAWCYYESRILGAHHGLISTYALEVMILYIINHFHSSLPGPLAVLHRFLEYYSTFDWDSYCVSINGPIATTSLPEFVADIPENSGNELLLSQEFLKSCEELFSVPIKAVELTDHQFPVKHLNIMDPLKSSNNIGRSVSKANFHRIRGAFLFGAQRLEEVLKLPAEGIGAGVEKFFANTLDRNGKGERVDAQVSVPAFGTGRSEASDLNGDYDNYYRALQCGQWYHNYTLTVPLQLSPSSSSQIHQESARGSLSQFPQCKTDVSCRRGTDVFVPRVPLCQPYPSHLYTATSGIGNTVKSRGTGTYIPDMRHKPYKDFLSWMRTRNPDSRSCNTLLKIPRKTYQVENFLRMEKDGGGSCLDLSPDVYSPKTEKSSDGSCLDLSLDQFPHLPSSRKSMSSENGKDHSSQGLLHDEFTLETQKNGNESCLDLSPDHSWRLPYNKETRSLEIYQTCRPVSKSPQEKDCFVALEGIRFGTFGPLLSKGLPLLTRKPADASAGPSTTASKTTQADQGKQNQLEWLESNEGMVHKQQYQLKNEDFPPLHL